MEWAIDTGAVGECDAKDLRKVLEQAREHWVESQTKAAGDRVFRIMNPEAKLDAAANKLLAVESARAEAECSAQAAALVEEMQAGIDAAVALAGVYGGIVTATVTGHNDERHKSHVGRRIQVSVDQVWR